MDIKRKRIFDSHAHIGAMGAFNYYGLSRSRSTHSDLSTLRPRNS